MTRIQITQARTVYLHMLYDELFMHYYHYLRHNRTDTFALDDLTFRFPQLFVIATDRKRL